MASINPTVLNCANSPHVSGKTDNHVRLTITGITQTDGDVNQTTVSYKITVEGTPWTYLYALYVELGGKVLYDHHTGGAILTSWTSGKVIHEGSVTFDNNPDGSLSLYAYIKQMFYYGNGDTSRWNNRAYYQDASTTMNCSTIARTSEASLSSSSVLLGNSVTIKTNRKATSLTHNVYYSIGNIGYTLIASGVGDSCSWTIPKSLAYQIPNSDNGTVSIKVITYSSSGNEIGTKLLSLQINVPDTTEFRPSIDDVSLQEMGNVPSSLGFYVQNMSKIKGTISASGAYGSSISNYSVSFNNERFSSSSFTSQIITSINPTLSVTVTDSRGRKATYIATVTVLEYNPPSINSFSSYRNINDPSKIDIKLSCTVYKLQNKNTKTITFFYRKTAGGTYSSVTVNISSLSAVESGNVITYSGTVNVATNVDINASYYSYLKVADLFKNVTSVNSYVNTNFRLINFSADKKAFAIGKLHEKQGHFEIGLPQTYYENIYRVEGDYEGIVLSCPAILKGMITYDSSNRSLNFTINGTSYGITIWASDEKLKDNIKNIKINYTDKIKSIEHISFDYIDGKKKVPIGYSANQLKEIDNNFVMEIGEDKTLQPNISVLIPAITKTMQELIERIETLERKLEKYESNKY